MEVNWLPARLSPCKLLLCKDIYVSKLFYKFKTFKFLYLLKSIDVNLLSLMDNNVSYETSLRSISEKSFLSKYKYLILFWLKSMALNLLSLRFNLSSLVFFEIFILDSWLLLIFKSYKLILLLTSIAVMRFLFNDI